MKKFYRIYVQIYNANIRWLLQLDTVRDFYILPVSFTKGDAGNAIVIQFTSDTTNDADIPDEAGSTQSAMSFGTLISAQALGDRQALIDNDRKVLKINLKDNVVDSIKLSSNSIS